MRVLIVEDELVIARRLERLLTEVLGADIIALHHCSALREAEKWLSEHEVDVVFLDLNLNGEDGFELVKDAAARAFHTVVISAHTDRAMEAFEIGVLDFIGKPFGKERIRKSVDRLQGARASHPAVSLAVRSTGRIDIIPVSNIAFVRAAGAYSELVLRDGKVRVHSKSLDRLMDVLPARFERIHRSYVVGIDEIVQIKVREGSRYSAILASGEEIPIGRTRVDHVRSRLAAS